jgi:hypothetical protein
MRQRALVGGDRREGNQRLDRDRRDLDGGMRSDCA